MGNQWETRGPIATSSDVVTLSKCKCSFVAFWFPCKAVAGFCSMMLMEETDHEMIAGKKSIYIYLFIYLWKIYYIYIYACRVSAHALLCNAPCHVPGRSSPKHIVLLTLA